MSNTQNPFFNFPTQGTAFLYRAKEALDSFDAEENVAKLLEAALHLRLGVEARLYEYLDVALQRLGQPKARLSQYRAQDLLAKLTRAAPDSIMAYFLMFTPVSSRRCEALTSQGP